MGRIIAIGDIHGCAAALAKMIEVITPRPGDTIVPLGDYVNRGPNSKGVLDQLIALSDRCKLAPILGNHDEMMLGAREGRSDFQYFLKFDGQSTLDSYGVTNIHSIPRAHFEILESCRPYFETDQHFFVHANYQPDEPLDRQDIHTLRWLSLRDYLPPAQHRSGKIAIVGHTAQSEILDLGYLKCIDTSCYKEDGWLTALDVASGQVWQVNQSGEVRE